MLQNILIGLAGVVVLFLAIVATRPSAYEVERKVEIAAPADLVFGVLHDLHRFGGVFVLFGSPLDELDSNLQKTFEGPAAGVGQSYAWSGANAGVGKLTIEESVPGLRVGLKLEFLKPMASTATCALTIEAGPTGSRVTWSMKGHHNFVGKAFGLFVNMDKMLGGDIEKGLGRLKVVTEASTSSPSTLTPS